jgi:hypothetical protein
MPMPRRRGSNQSIGVPMTGIDKSTKRAVAAIVLLVLAASALRGYLPGRERAPREQPSSNPAALFLVVALVSVALAIVAIAVIIRLRDRRALPAARDPLPRGPGGTATRPTWRFLLITLGVVIVWLLINVLLARLGGLFGVDQPPPGPGPNAQPPSSGTAPPPRPPPEGDGKLFSYLAGATVIFLLVIAMGTVAASRGRPPVTRAYPVAGDPAPQTAAATESLARAAELGLVEIGDFSREPREAIIACYAAMERELMRVPIAAPQDCDTPTEVLARAVEHHALHADSATQLVDLFEEARFSPHVMNEGHRGVAVRALRLVVAELRSAA